MKILVLNSGSSSLKYQVIDMDTEKMLVKGYFERIGQQNSFLTHKVNGIKHKFEKSVANHEQALEFVFTRLTNDHYGVIKSLDELGGIGHRVVQGGEKYSQPVIITDDVIAEIEKCSDLAPLHNPAAILGIKACKKIAPNIPMVAVFDTAFHQSIPKERYIYPIPYEYYKKYGIRKYGAHGTSHEYVAHRVAEIMEKDIKDLKIVTCHLGNGCSLAAVKGGKSIDTSMGFTPLAGIMMGTRAGSIDPSVISFLIEEKGYTIEQVDEMLNKKSGVLGVSGVSSDFRDVRAAAQEGNERAQLALDIFHYKIKTQIAAYAGAMGGIDVIVFTAGIGENAALVRSESLKGLEFLGFNLDAKKNEIAGEIGEISTDDSRVKVYVIPTNEELMIARDTARLAQ